MAVKDGLPATDLSRMNREYVKNLADGESVPDGLPATDLSRMNREWIKAVVEEAGGGSGGDIEVEAATFTENGTFTAPEGKAYSPVIVNVPTGGSGFPATLINTLTMAEDVNAVQFEWTATLDAYDVVYMMIDFELTSSDWLYFQVDDGVEAYGYQLTHHKAPMIKYNNESASRNLALPAANASPTSFPPGKVIPDIGSIIKIRVYTATKYIKAGSTIEFWGWNYEDF